MVRFEYQFAVVTPGIGKWFVFGRFVFGRFLAIKPQPRRAFGEMNADKCSLRFAMHLALDLVSHCPTILMATIGTCQQCRQTMTDAQVWSTMQITILSGDEVIYEVTMDVKNFFCTLQA